MITVRDNWWIVPVRSNSVDPIRPFLNHKPIEDSLDIWWCTMYGGHIQYPSVRARKVAETMIHLRSINQCRILFPQRSSSPWAILGVSVDTHFPSFTFLARSSLRDQDIRECEGLRQCPLVLYDVLVMQFESLWNRHGAICIHQAVSSRSILQVGTFHCDSFTARALLRLMFHLGVN